MALWSSALGWLALTLALLLGIGMGLQRVPGFHRDPMFGASLMVWGVYAFAFTTRVVLGWRGARSVGILLAGFILAFTVMLGSTFFWKSFHR
jgi:hypothetical protein